MEAVSCPAFTNVVVRLLPFHCTTEVLTKLLPFTVNVNAPEPALTVFGDTVVITGTGLELALTVVGSVAESFTKLVSPPPETETLLVTLTGAVAETFTVMVITGYEPAAASTSERVQVCVPTTHTHPAPAMLVAVSGPGRMSFTTTVPAVGAVPEFVAVME